MKGAIARAEEIADSEEKSCILSQFDNPANPDAHYKTTAEEILSSMDGKLDFYVAGVGTGGTLSGTARRLKEVLSSIQVVAVEPEKSPVISGGAAAPHKIQGIGAGFIPENYDGTLVDQVVPVSDEDAMETARQLAGKEGILCGISGGAAAKAALDLAGRPENQGKTVLFILPDTGERYLSTPLFGDNNV